MIGVGLRHRQERAFVGLRDVRIGRHAEFRDDRRAVGLTDVVHEKAAVGLVVGMKRQPQQPLFARMTDDAGDVEERLLPHPPLLNDADASGLLHDKEPAAAVSGVGDVDGMVEAVGDDRLQGDGGQRRAGRDRNPGQTQHGDGNRGAPEPFHQSACRSR